MFIPIIDAINELRQGRMIILVDDENREQEGDLIVAAEKITPEMINFMITHARGILCLTLAPEIVERLQLPLMPARNRLPDQALFTASIEAMRGVTSGVSVEDRAHTIKVAVNPNATPDDISMPGHIFPIQARAGGVLERQGHTEGSVDLAKLAGLEPAAVLCEIMQADGKMARMPALVEFAKIHGIKMAAINDLIRYRQENKGRICHHLT
jgi:3,4-dihydroxy 2-butanone 4-phosphate synthase/GTP cyclohydrolase II